MNSTPEPIDTAKRRPVSIVAVPSASPAWVEIDVGALAENVRLLRAQIDPRVRFLYVVKDDAYGLGAVVAARTALRHGADSLGVVNLAEAAELRGAGITEPILVLGERLPEELATVLDLEVESAVGSLQTAFSLNRLAEGRQVRIPVHIKVNTGMNRFGFSWRQSAHWSAELAALRGLEFAGVFSHFAQSDESDKAFAREQLSRFRSALEALNKAGVHPRLLHHANSGGLLDLPDAHFDLVRVGILAHGVYPSAVCRRIPGLKSVMTVKARIVAEQLLDPGDSVGYGMRWQARRVSRVGVLPVGYGDGFPRVRNEGYVLMRGQRAPIVGGVTMDALMIDLTELNGVRVGEEAVLMGRQGDGEITTEDLAALKRSVCYDVLLGWRHRLPRIYVGG